MLKEDERRLRIAVNTCKTKNIILKNENTMFTTNVNTKEELKCIEDAEFFEKKMANNPAYWLGLLTSEAVRLTRANGATLFATAAAEDKPILLDYWTDSLDKKALIGVRETGEKLLVKSAEEYTSPIAKFYKSGTEYIIITENSIYIVSSEIANKRIS